MRLPLKTEYACQVLAQLAEHLKETPGALWSHAMISRNRLKKAPDLAGVSPWILKDFLSPRRMNWKYQEYWNRKGLISPEGNKKAAFSVLRDWYDEIALQGDDR